MVAQKVAIIKLIMSFMWQICFSIAFCEVEGLDRIWLDLQLSLGSGITPTGLREPYAIPEI